MRAIYAAIYLYIATARWTDHGYIMKVQGSRRGKALGIGELLAGARSASATLNQS